MEPRYIRAADVAEIVEVASIVDRIAVRAATPSAQHRPEYMVPKCCADTIVSGRKSVMALMMLEKRQRQFIGTVMRAVVHEQIPEPQALHTNKIGNTFWENFNDSLPC